MSIERVVIGVVCVEEEVVEIFLGLELTVVDEAIETGVEVMGVLVGMEEVTGVIEATGVVVEVALEVIEEEEVF